MRHKCYKRLCQLYLTHSGNFSTKNCIIISSGSEKQTLRHVTKPVTMGLVAMESCHVTLSTKKFGSDPESIGFITDIMHSIASSNVGIFVLSTSLRWKLVTNVSTWQRSRTRFGFGSLAFPPESRNRKKYHFIIILAATYKNKYISLNQEQPQIKQCGIEKKTSDQMTQSLMEHNGLKRQCICYMYDQQDC